MPPGQQGPPEKAALGGRGSGDPVGASDGAGEPREPRRGAYPGLCAKLLQSCLTLTPWTAEEPGSSVHGLLQARVLEWVAISSSRDLPDMCLLSLPRRSRVVYHYRHLGSPGLS